MTLKQLEDLLAAARSKGAGDTTTVYLDHKGWEYMRDIATAVFQKREGWPEKEWPVVITSKQ